MAIFGATQTVKAIGAEAPIADNASKSATSSRAVKRGLTCDQYGRR
jgi:hypothetical protein